MKLKHNYSVIVLGSRGMLGTALVYHLRSFGHSIRAVDRSQFDTIRDPLKRLELKGVDYVINAIGLINRRLCAGAADFYLVNSVFPHVLADYCIAKSTRLIHISTDCVFDDQKSLYTENDEPSATDLYGRSKTLGEPANCMVLRTSLIGPEQSNHYSLLNWFLTQSNSCRGYQNHKWNGMTTAQFSRIIDRIMQSDIYVFGVRHVFSNDITKLKLLQLIKNAYQHQVDIVPWNDTIARDRRLRTVYPEFVKQLEIADLEEQIAELPRFSDTKGKWRNLK